MALFQVRALFPMRSEFILWPLFPTVHQLQLQLRSYSLRYLFCGQVIENCLICGFTHGNVGMCLLPSCTLDR